jgi:hypothetical protein
MVRGWMAAGVLLVFLPSLALAGDVPAQQARGLRVAVYEATPSDEVSLRVARVVSDSLLAEVRKLERISAIGTAEIREMLEHESQRQLLGCEDDTMCLNELAGALGVDEIVTITLEVVGNQSHVRISRLDVLSASPLGAYNRQYAPAGGEEFLAAIGPAIQELYPDHALRPGRTRGVSPEVARQFNPPPLPRWVFVTTASLAGVTTVAGTVFSITFADAQRQYTDTINQSLVTPVQASQVLTLSDQVERRAQAANIAWIATGALAVTAGVQALLTDWHGHRRMHDEPAPARAQVTVTPGGFQVALTW